MRFAGKGERKVVAVFGSSAASCQAAVLYVRAGAPGVPVWLFSTVHPLAETACLCEHVEVDASPLALLLRAERLLWSRWMAMGVAAWTGESDHRLMKLAPFLIPPGRALLLNENGDFFEGRPGRVCTHAARRVREGLRSAAQRASDWTVWLQRLITYDVWRSGPVRRVQHVWAAYTLLAASWLWRCCRGGLLKQFDGLHGEEPLDVFVAPADGRTITVAGYRAPDWDARKIAASCWSGGARWVVIREDGAPDEPIDDLLPLLEDERTFAVARQEYFRAWRSLLFPMAPFRELQPGEASQVLAPLSGTIVVDRRKLLALGIPDRALAGTAWMELFWKAAAAGWRSYSVGGQRSSRELPALPVQETGFLLELVRDDELRRLGPREPDLSRGAISFSPRVPQAGPDKPRVLVVSPFLPYPLAHGGAVRMFNLCRVLAEHVDFALVAVREAGERVDYAKLYEVFREVYVVDKDERASGDDSLPEQVRQHQSRALRALIAELARTWKPDLLQVEYTHMAAVRNAAPEIPAILVEHDLTFSLYDQLASKKDAGREARREHRRWLEFERRWLKAYDGVWTVSEEDRRTAIREGERAGDCTFAVPNGVDVERYFPCFTAARKPEILYVGSFRHLPNVLGFRKLCDEVMPRVWKHAPDVLLRVVAGPDWERYWPSDAPASPQIEMHSFVEDLRPLYARASVVAVPLEISAGTNIKVLEAMACGKALVTTPVGCSGLDLENGRDASIVADWNLFADSILELLARPELRELLGAHARRTAVERFSWNAIGETAYESYGALTRGAEKQVLLA